MLNSLYVKIIGALLGAGLLSGGAGIVGTAIGKNSVEPRTQNAAQAACLTADKNADCDTITNNIVQKSDEEIEGLVNDLKGITNEE